MFHKSCRKALSLVALGLCSTETFVFGDEPTKAQDQAKPSVAERFEQIRAEYDAQQAVTSKAQDQAKSESEAIKIWRKLAPDDMAYSRRMVELAATAPADPGAREALIWVINKHGMPDRGPYGDEFARAAALLARHHGDDPEAIRIGLSLDNVLSSHRDTLLLSFLASAKGREAKGLARIALAPYLESKARYADFTRDFRAGHKLKFPGFDDDGKEIENEVELSAEEYAYILDLRLCDPKALRAEAERLYHEVIAEYADVPFLTVHLRELEALAKQPTPTVDGKPLTADERRQLAKIVSRKQTLGEVAKGRLDEMHNLAVGKPAPEIDGVDIEGKPLKLSDYRGKVVALVFWGTWCGPCMAEVPHERELVERLKDKPFALLGVNCDEDKQAAIKVMKAERITWPNWNDGAPDTGPIVNRYHVRGYPTCLIIDAEGIIRYKDAYGKELDKAVDQLLEKLEAKGAGK